MKGDAKPFTKLLLVSAAVELLKMSIQEPRPAGCKPTGCKPTGCKPVGCDALGIGGVSRSFGMPSGHVATAVAGWVMVAQNFQASLNTQVLVGVLAALLMSWARVTVGCHTLSQSIMGALVGLLAAAA